MKTETEQMALREFNDILNEIEARAEEAGPAESWHPENWDMVTLQWLHSYDGRPARNFIAASRTDVPALVKALRRARTHLEIHANLYHSTDGATKVFLQRCENELASILKGNSKTHEQRVSSGIRNATPVSLKSEK